MKKKKEDREVLQSVLQHQSSVNILAPSPKGHSIPPRFGEKKKRNWGRFYVIAFVVVGIFAITATAVQVCYNGERPLPSWLSYGYYKSKAVNVRDYCGHTLSDSYGYCEKKVTALMATFKAGEKKAAPKTEKAEPPKAIAVATVETVPASKPTVQPTAPKDVAEIVANTKATATPAATTAVPIVPAAKPTALTAPTAPVTTSAKLATPSTTTPPTAAPVAAEQPPKPKLANKEDPPKANAVPSLVKSPMEVINLDKPPSGFGIPTVPATPVVPKTATVNKPVAGKEKPAKQEPRKGPAPQKVLVNNEPKPTRSLQVEVNLSEQEVIVTERGAVIFRSNCSSGRPTLPTPSGVTTTVTSKDPKRRSNQYQSMMPWFVDLGLKDASGEGRAIGIHEGVVRGYPGTHKCIRLPKGKAQEFYELVEKGTPVTLTGNAWSYLQRKFPGFKLLDFDRDGNLIGFKRDSQGGVPREFLDYINKGGKVDICSIKPNGEIADPPLKDRSTWFLMFEFMDNPRKQGFSVTEFERKTAITVSFNAP